MPSLMQGNLSGAMRGMLNSGIAGAKSGYWNALQQQDRDQRQLAQTMNADLRRESLAIDHAAAAFAAVRSCRLAQAQRIKSAMRARRTDGSDARRQLMQEHDWFAEEIDVAQKAGINMQKRDDQFAYAAESLREKSSESPRSESVPQDHAAASASRVQPQTQTAITTSATETLPQKRNSFDSSVKEAQAESNTAFSLDNSAARGLPRYA